MTFQSSLPEFEEDFELLTDAEQEIYEAVEQDGYGTRQYARKTDQSAGTVGNLLRRARRKLGGEAA